MISTYNIEQLNKTLTDHDKDYWSKIFFDEYKKDLD